MGQTRRRSTFCECSVAITVIVETFDRYGRSLLGNSFWFSPPRIGMCDFQLGWVCIEYSSILSSVYVRCTTLIMRGECRRVSRRFFRMYTSVQNLLVQVHTSRFQACHDTSRDAIAHRPFTIFQRRRTPIKCSLIPFLKTQADSTVD